MSEEFQSRPNMIKRDEMAVQLLAVGLCVAVLIPHLIPPLCCLYLTSQLRRRQRAKQCQSFSPQVGAAARVQDTFEESKQEETS